MTKVLVVDSDEVSARAVDDLLSREGYETEFVANSNQAIGAITVFQPDLIILEVVMPGVDGISLCLQIRRESDVPIMFLTTRREPPDRVVGLRIGADDYMGKPYDADELLARVAALLRRRVSKGSSSAQAQLRFGKLIIDLASVQVVNGEHPIHLTPTEFKLLLTFAKKPGEVYTREELLWSVWGYEPGSDTRLVDVHVARLRKKLQDASVTEVTVEAARGFGYKLNVGSSAPTSSLQP